MALRRIAIAIGEPMLLTLDDETLLAFDAGDGAPRWQLTFEHVLSAVAYTSAAALPAAPEGSPWRSSATTSSTAIVVDVKGGVHLVDARAGTVIGAHEAGGAVGAMAASSDAFALGLADEVALFRDGRRRSFRHRATALCFSRDGSTLAIGTKKAVVLVGLGADAQPKVVAVRGPVLDLAARPAGEWLAGTERGVVAIDAAGTKARSLIGDVSAQVVAIDRGGKSVAVLRYEAAAAVFELPPAEPTRLFTDERRTIEDLAFADAGTLAVALDGGDACLVSLALATVQRTEPHAGRTRRAGGLRVEVVEPPPPSEPSDPPPRSRKSPLGIGFAVAIALFVVRLVLIASRSSSPDLPTIKGPIHMPPSSCDESCGKRRLTDLRNECARQPELDCLDVAEHALVAFRQHRCDDVRRDLATIKAGVLARDGGDKAVLVSATRTIAELGLRTSCREEPKAAPPEQEEPQELVRLEGPRLDVAKEEPLPIAEGESPRALWVAPDGPVFLGTTSTTGRCRLHERSKTGAWSTSLDRVSCDEVTLFGRGKTDVYAALASDLHHWNGKEWSSAGYSGAAIRALARPSGDGDANLFVLDEESNVHAASVTHTWSRERLPVEGSTLQTMWSAGDVLYVAGEDEDGNARLFRRTTDRAWTMLSRDASPYARSGRIWGGPDGMSFTASTTHVDVSRDRGATWKTSEPIEREATSIWGRTSSDVFVGGAGGLTHWDGKAWKATPFDRPVSLVAGNTAALYVVAGTKAPP
ncbi:MAG: hypothetical protein KIT84_35780 [Labilithrix sp.]|nr:hypothetical protein [Labilithrix sp.]MCW5816414.1 hypothetical protein [Labilithrix sp.]